MMYLPPGYYTLEKLINVINSYVEEYDINFTILSGGRVAVIYNIEREYLFSDESIKDSHIPYQNFQEFPQSTDDGRIRN
jgi:hypothetical protein